MKSILFFYLKVLFFIICCSIHQESNAQVITNLSSGIWASSGCVGDAIKVEVVEQRNSIYYHEWVFPNHPRYITSDPFTYHTFASSGTYIVTVVALDAAQQHVDSFSITLNVPVCTLSNDQCIESFAPIPGERYVLSAWVKDNASVGAITYENPTITVKFPIINNSVGPFKGSKEIIDGWQRIEEVFEIPGNAEEITIVLENMGNTNDVYFDDIRIHPFKATMKSFVYDPSNLRLLAELDERNYATFYEYDEEGALIRIEKETERGRKTIQESSSNIHKD